MADQVYIRLSSLMTGLVHEREAFWPAISPTTASRQTGRAGLDLA
jgi:hypothetical protein